MKHFTEDVVNHPAHYQARGVECIEAMEEASRNAELTPFCGYLWLNAFKYLWRWPYKNGLEDLKKCRWYLDKLIGKLEDQEEQVSEGADYREWGL